MNQQIFSFLQTWYEKNVLFHDYFVQSDKSHLYNYVWESINNMSLPRKLNPLFMVDMLGSHMKGII